MLLQCALPAPAIAVTVHPAPPSRQYCCGVEKPRTCVQRKVKRLCGWKTIAKFEVMVQLCGLQFWSCRCPGFRCRRLFGALVSDQKYAFRVAVIFQAGSERTLARSPKPTQHLRPKLPLIQLHSLKANPEDFRIWT